MEQAWWSGVIAKSAKTLPLTDLQIDVDAKPNDKMPWQAIKAALAIALPPEPKE